MRGKNDVNAVIAELERRLKEEVGRKDESPTIEKRVKLKIEEYARKNAALIARRFCGGKRRECLPILAELCRRYKAEYIEEYLRECKEAGIGVLAPLVVYRETGVLPSIEALRRFSRFLHIIESCIEECLPYEL